MDSVEGGTLDAPPERWSDRLARFRKFHAGPVSSAWFEARRGARRFSWTADLLRLLQGAVMAGDGIAIVSASLFAFRCRHATWTEPVEASSMTLLMAGLTVVMMNAGGAYIQDLVARRSGFGRAAVICCILFMPLLFLAWLSDYPPTYWRTWVLLWWAGALIGVLLVRMLAGWRRRIWVKSGRLARIVAIVDISGGGRALAGQIVCSGGSETCLLGVFSAARREIDELVRLTRMFRVDEVIVAYQRDNESALASVIKALESVPANVHVYSGSLPAAVPLRGAGLLFANPVITVRRRPLTGWGRVTKRAEDVVLAGLLLLMLMPLMTAIAVAIKGGDGGPVLFRQRRLGFNNNEFAVLKFRTMVQSTSIDERGVPQARRGDPRVTRVGRVLRRTSIDELPQLLNVLHGEMSLVGPRPHALPHNEYYAGLIDGYLARHRVQPGITGWAQVNGFRGETDTLEKMQRRVACDQAYVENWSLWLDLKILLLTFVALKGAY